MILTAMALPPDERRDRAKVNEAVRTIIALRRSFKLEPSLQLECLNPANCGGVFRYPN
jgi:hypothetical protein